MPSEVEDHDHCRACYDSNCNARLPSCNIIQCELDCGARFHACKQREHGLLCGNEKVPCFNASYGCPMQVQRSQMSRHLAGCPASLVHCTMEWNRWPVCSSERQSRQPVPYLTDCNREQLDIALALRDQRMLTKSMRASVRTRRILTNNLNRRHPAVPLANQLTVENREMGKEFNEQRELENLLQDMHQWENAPERKRSRSPAGLRQSICDELYRASQDTVQHLSTAIHAITGDVACPPQRPDFSLGSTLYPYIHCAHCERRKERMDRLMESHNAMKENGEASPNHQDSSKLIANQNCDTDHLQDNGVHFQVISDLLPYETNGEKQSEKLRQDSSPASLDAQQGYRSSSSSEGSLNDIPMPALFVTPSTTGEVSAAPGRGHSKILVVEPPTMIPGSGVACFPAANSDSPLQASLSLELSLESITRYQAKPDSMYTFLCAQVFRRDEFASHFQNVHSDIHGGLNGWLEQRCPLAPYGCTYSQRRFYPGEKKARVVHHEHLESFGVQLDWQGCQPTRSKDFSRVDTVVEMEWVPLNESDKTIQTTENSKECEDTMNADFKPVADSSDSGFLEQSGFETKKIDPDSRLIKENRIDQSEVSLHAMDQSGQSLICTETQHDEENDKCSESLKSENHNDKLVDLPQAAKSCNQVDAEYPTIHSVALVQNPTSQSESPTEKEHQSEPDFLSQLPSEILRYMTKFLDAFSLCNLALTSKLLRQICCSILDERGMVLQHWEKVEGRWKVACRVWQFSTAFTPVHLWGFEDHPSLAVHLAKCPYNVKLRQTEPVRVMIAEGATAAKANGDEQEAEEVKVKTESKCDDEDSGIAPVDLGIK